MALAAIIICLLNAPFAWPQTSAALPTEQSSLFSGSGNCADCHSANGTALVDSTGTGLSFSTDWRSTLMASAARNPYWQAKVESEVAENVRLAQAIETKCTRCHAPLGKAQSTHDGAENYRLDEAWGDPLSPDVVSCTLCHQIQDGNLGGEPPSCSKSADVQASGAVDVSDPLYILNHLLLGGAAPAAPYPGCGHGSDAKPLGCASFPPSGR